MVFKLVLLASLILGPVTLSKEPASLRDSILVVLSINGQPGATAFQIKHRGKNYIVTNKHVCVHYAYAKRLVLRTIEGKPFRAKILRMAKKSDLCLVAGNPKLPSLSLGHPAKVQENVYMITHSEGSFLIARKGVVKLYQSYKSLYPLLSEKLCKLSEGRVRRTESGGFCESYMDEFLCTVRIIPGNSGSPLFTADGLVTGVAYAYQVGTGIGAFIPLKSLKKLLR